MNGKQETGNWTWLNRLIAVATLGIAGIIMVGCHDHDDDDYYYTYPDLRDADVDTHYVSAQFVAPGDELIVGIDVRSKYDYSGDFVTRYYLSFNDTITDNDILLGTYYSAGLDYGERERQWISAIVPNIPSGWYFLGAIIDERDEVSEQYERNNVVLFSQYVYVESPALTAAAEEVVEQPVAEIPEVNFPPIATCAHSDVFGSVGAPINLTASGSSDPEGAALTYSWIATRLPEGANATAFANVSGDNMITKFTPTKVGNYTFMVTVSDGENDSTDSVTIIVE